MSFFFFKQKTAYEMRISDWSSDVCSSDLQQIGKQGVEIDGLLAQQSKHLAQAVRELLSVCVEQIDEAPLGAGRPTFDLMCCAGTGQRRSEERRVGKECVSTCRSRWSPYH